MAVHEDLRATVAALESPILKRPGAWEPQPYRNRRNEWGAYVQFWQSESWHSLSVHRFPLVLTPEILASLVKGVETIDEFRFGIYANSRDIPGFYATARSTHPVEGTTDRWIMISRSHERNFAKILRRKLAPSDEDLDLADYLESQDSRLKWEALRTRTGYGDCEARSTGHRISM